MTAFRHGAHFYTIMEQQGGALRHILRAYAAPAAACSFLCLSRAGALLLVACLLTLSEPCHGLLLCCAVLSCSMLCCTVLHCAVQQS